MSLGGHQATSPSKATRSAGVANTVADFNSSRQQMNLFSSSQPLHECRSAFSPDTAVSSNSWDDTTPPPYDFAAAQNSRKVARDVTIVHTPNLLSPRKRKSSRATPRSFSRPFKPGIKVNTAVSRHYGSTPQQVFPSPRRTPSAEEHNGGWVRKWSQLHRSRTNKSSRLEGVHRGAPRTSLSNKNLHLDMPHDDLDGVTPSDRAIPIAFFSTTPSSEHSQAPNLGRSAHNPALTPSICITPAQPSTDWSFAQPAQGALGAPRLRPASSVYSQATNWRYNMAQAAADTPSLPPLPPLFATAGDRSSGHKVGTFTVLKRESEYTTFDDDSKYEEQTRSADTVFEEDRTPGSANSIKHRFARRPRDLAIDTTLPTPRRSRGWWNVIVTPFDLNRSGSKGFKSPLSATVYPPGVRELTEAAQKQQVEHSPGSASQFGSRSISRTPPHGENEGHNARGAATVGLTSGTHQRNESQQSIFSPNDRTVPLVLDNGLAMTMHAADTAPLQAIQATVPVTEEQPTGSEALRRHQSPSSIRSTTPILGTAWLGTTHSARSVQHSPKPPSSHSPDHNSRTVVVVNLQTGEKVAEPEPVAQVAYLPHAQYAQSPNYAKPVTTLLGFSSINDKGTSQATLPPAFIDVKSVWEPEDPPHQKSEKRSRNDQSKRDKRNKPKKKRRRFLCCICLFLLLLIAIIVALAVTLTRKHGTGHTGSTNAGGNGSGHSSNDTGSSRTKTSSSTAISFVNLTGFPPMPTGEMTIAQPTLLAQVNGCTDPTALWSCDLPKEDQQGNEPAGSAVPNFWLSITFNNDTGSGNERRQSLRFKRVLGGSPFAPNPSPPSEQDQIFLGNTTEHNDEPFQGEETPFYISFLSPNSTSTSSTKVKRSTPRSTTTITSGTSTANFATTIPSPSVNDDGTASPANLIPSPLPSNQPLRLYNRGKSDEHYGFYTYFDRSIFLRSVSVTDISEINQGQIPADRDGGSAETGANARCTWRQTRFLVQIWTRTSAPLLSTQASSSTSTTSTGSDDSAQPGPIPYPVTITTDRHGGTPDEKMIYCYALNDVQQPVPLNKTLYFEDRGFQGTLVNPQQAFQDDQIDPREPASRGGIDGGTGGCGCRWGNWDDSRDF